MSGDVLTPEERAHVAQAQHLSARRMRVGTDTIRVLLRIIDRLSTPQANHIGEPTAMVAEVARLQAEAARVEIEALRVGCASVRRLLSEEQDRLTAALRARDEARAEVARLREAIEQAPHAPSCVTVCGLGDYLLKPCDCWKSRALSKGGDR